MEKVSFVELYNPKRQLEDSKRRIEVLTSIVEPKLCRKLLQDISKLEGSEKKEQALAHLKRVKRYQKNRQNKEEKEEKKKDRQRNLQLEVLLGKSGEEGILKSIITSYNLKLERKLVPVRAPESQQEAKEFNALWPTIYFQKRTEEYKAAERELSISELEQMRYGMEQAIKYDDAVIIDPVSGSIISKSQDELSLQKSKLESLSNIGNTPILCSRILLAIQGVSRRERKVALGLGMDSRGFQDGQYLCTGYDIYVKDEPNVFESMALVHSRIRRVVFLNADHAEGGVGGAGSHTDVHNLPETNHKYRAFRCVPG